MSDAVAGFAQKPKVEPKAPAWTVLGAIVLGLAVLVLLYWPTATSAVAQWNSTSAYSYGYLIGPIALWLIWRERDRLVGLMPEPTAWGIAVAAAFAGVWLVADFLSIAEGRHIALMGMIQGLLLAALGWRIYRILLFPLLYLWLMVPTGTFLLGPLQRLSHAGAVALIKLSAIPVFAEGTSIEVPEGSFVVEPGCAGLNFLLTALALSLLYGKLNYRGLGARLLCIAVALAVSMIANILRIYLIVVLTQITHRKLDIADDHLLYGWGFFALVMLGMMWLGSRFAKPEDPPRAAPVAVPGHAPIMKLVAVLGVLLIVAMLPPRLAMATGRAAITSAGVAMPAAIGPWQRVSGTTDWRPQTDPAAGFGEALYTWNGLMAEVAMARYAAQGGGRDAASGGNQPAISPWETEGLRIRSVEAGPGRYAVVATTARRSGATRAIDYWYASAGCVTPSRLKAKLCAAAARLRGRPAPGAFIAISTPWLGDSQNDAAAAAQALDGLAAALIAGDIPANSNAME